MKFLILTLFVVAAATSAPLEDPSVDPVEVIVNGVPEDEPLEIGHIVDIALNEKANGEILSSANLLHPFSAAGLAEIAAADAAANEEPVNVIDTAPEVVDVIDTAPETVDVIETAPEVVEAPEAVAPIDPEDIGVDPVVLPTPVLPPGGEVVEEIPQPIVLPEPALPEVVDPVAPIEIPEPALPEVVPEPTLPELVPETIAPEGVQEPESQIPNGEIFNDGNVVITVNAPQEAGVLASLQSWFQMVVNYIQNGVMTSQQIV